VYGRTGWPQEFGQNLVVAFVMSFGATRSHTTLHDVESLLLKLTLNEGEDKSQYQGALPKVGGKGGTGAELVRSALQLN